jgi:hypothetical protein
MVAPKLFIDLVVVLDRKFARSRGCVFESSAYKIESLLRSVYTKQGQIEDHDEDDYKDILLQAPIVVAASFDRLRG